MLNKIIFITGCSSGIGFDAAMTFKQRGHQVIASCRKPVDVERLVSLGLETVLLDVDDEHSIQTAFDAVMEKTAGKLDILINNAGYGQAGALEDVPRAALIAQFNTNVFGLMALTQRVIPIMRAQGHGRIINVSSLLGFVSMPFRGAYNASKYAVEGLSDTLRLELKSSGIAVITIEPGPIDSCFRDRSVDESLKQLNLQTSHFKDQYQYMLSEFKTAKEGSMFTLKAAAVSRRLIHAVESKSPKAKYLVTFPAYLFMVLKRVLSVKLLDRVMGFITKRER
jgi:NAD(P)-dependent dehydrogenase (short-subunit alcohol dehydrogenase family)